MAADPLCILVVDDVAESAQALGAVLELDGHVVRMAHSGELALALAETFRPHCALLDIDMPGMNGHELASKLRARFGVDIVIIAVTGWGKPDDSWSADFAGFDHYLRKPFDVAKLRKLLPLNH